MFTLELWGEGSAVLVDDKFQLMTIQCIIEVEFDKRRESRKVRGNKKVKKLQSYTYIDVPKKDDRQ